jgi:hypothetical protein
MAQGVEFGFGQNPYTEQLRIMRPYKSARLRFERAIAHGERLAKLWNEIPTDYLGTPKALVDPDGDGVLYVSKVGAVPDELSLILGEHLYQLRATLDSCIYQATVYATGKNPPSDENKLEFPLTFDPKEWPKLATRRLSALPSGVQRGIEIVQPYHALCLTPEEMVTSIPRSLGILNDLARKDRHRQLHIVGSWPLEVKPNFTFPPGVSLRSFKVTPPSVFRAGLVIARFSLDGYLDGMQVGVVPNIKTNFGTPEPPVACHPTDTFDKRLAEMVNAVGSVLVAFEQGF